MDPSRSLPRRLRPPRAGAAFTLIELMVVIIIIGLIGGVTVVTINSVAPNQRLNTAVRNLSEVLYEARAKAIADSHEYQIHYDLDADSYRVRTPFRAEGGGYATSEEEERLWIHATRLFDEFGVKIEQVLLYDDVYVDGQVMIPFGPLGTTAGHSVVLYQELFERHFTLEVLPLTGDIRFHDGIHERARAEEEDFK